MQAAEPQVRLRTSRPSLRDGLNGLYVLSPGNGSVAPVIALRVRAPRFSACTAAPRPHDFAERTGPFVRMDNHAATRCAHRIPRSTSVTLAIRPCNEAGCAGVNHDFQKIARGIYLRRKLDRAPKSSGPKHCPAATIQSALSVRHCEEPKATKQSSLSFCLWIASLRSQ